MFIKNKDNIKLEKCIFKVADIIKRIKLTLSLNEKNLKQIYKVQDKGLV